MNIFAKALSDVPGSTSQTASNGITQVVTLPDGSTVLICVKVN
jgi:hypothetical protein